MLCSNCGFENPSGHRFCGMCGTPLPQPPITVPDAQSTVRFTRLPVEVSQAAPSSIANGPDRGAPAAIKTPETQPTSATEPNYFSQAEQAESIEQFIAGFRYTPPVQEDEVTMTGAKPELDSATKYEPAVPISLSEEPSMPVAEPPAKVEEPLAPQALPVEQAAVRDDASAAESLAEQLSPVITEPPPFATKGIKEQAPERSRFLDFSEPPAEEVPKSPETSIGGPSFLGLSDTPATPAYISDESDLGTTHASHWRAWTAVIVICVFAALGILEWRAEKGQSNNGPIGIMKMQIERLKGKKGAIITPPASSEAATQPAQPSSTSPPANSGPQMQAAPQQKPQTTNPQPAGSQETTPEKPANPGAASNAPAPPVTKVQSAATPTSSTTGNVAAGGPKPQPPTAKAGSANSTSAQAANGSPNSTAQSADTAESKTEKPGKTTTPGAEEFAKAATASDSAAASAWLWKAVAKGNPEAPVKLANMYIKGDGVPQSCDQAMVLLRSAAAKENAAARSRLGALYATGTCVPRNRVRAYEYMSEAVKANPNAAWARDFREQLWIKMTPQERQQAQAAQ
ncbi:MAG: zinc-ribbon domain-containing protein [Acidobacteriota bacterium]|nr:zinc-ribbon domain-containing protein [Acidobacteriota bacterium]